MEKFDIIIRKSAAPVEEFEYFCFDCGQLRLSFANINTCGNCESNQIRKATIGTLDKGKLKKDYISRKIDND